MTIAQIRKAITALVFAALGAYGTAMLDGDLTGREAIAAAGFALVTAGAVYKIRNAGVSVAGNVSELVDLRSPRKRVFVVGRAESVLTWINIAKDAGRDDAFVMVTSPVSAQGRVLAADDAVVMLDPDPNTLNEWNVVELISGRTDS